MYGLGLGLESQVLGLASCSLGLDVAGLVNITGKWNPHTCLAYPKHFDFSKISAKIRGTFLIHKSLVMSRAKRTAATCHGTLSLNAIQYALVSQT
jgi:hypothetical protein